MKIGTSKNRTYPAASVFRLIDDDKSPALVSWMQRLNRVFHIDIETCSECGGEVRIIASIEDPAVINMRRQGSGRPASRNQSQKNTQQGSFQR